MKITKTIGAGILALLLLVSMRPDALATAGISTEVQVTTNDLTVRQLNRLMRNVSGNYQNDILNEQYVSKGSFLEKASCDGVWCMFTEGEIYVRSYGYHAIVQKFILIPVVTYKSDRTERWKQNMEGYESTFPDFEYFSDTQPGKSPLLSGFRFFEQHGPLSEPRQHSFSISEKILQPDQSGLLSVDFITDSSRQRIYKGRMLVSIDDERVHQIILEQVPFHSVNFFRWLNAESEITFKYVNERAYLSEITTRLDRRGVDYVVSARFDEPVLYNAEFNEMDYWDISNQTVNPWVPEITTLDHFESTFISDLSAIRADLEREKTLERQFIDNSNQPWRYNLDFDGEKHLGHSGERIFENARMVAEEIRKVLE